MLDEDAVLSALEKPQKFFPLKMKLTPREKFDAPLQDFLLKLRAENKVTFSIQTGRWSKV